MHRQALCGILPPVMSPRTPSPTAWKARNARLKADGDALAAAIAAEVESPSQANGGAPGVCPTCNGEGCHPQATAEPGLSVNVHCEACDGSGRRGGNNRAPASLPSLRGGGADVAASFAADPDGTRQAVAGELIPLAVVALRLRLQRGDRSAINTTFKLAKWLDVDKTLVINLLSGYGVSSERELRGLVERARAADGVTDEQAQLQCAQYLADAARRGDLTRDAGRALADALAVGAAPGVGDDPPPVVLVKTGAPQTEVSAKAVIGGAPFSDPLSTRDAVPPPDDAA